MSDLTPGDWPDLPAPAQPYIYCLNCFYNLHGLAEERCPECGRRFDRSDSRTYSKTPNPQHLPKLVQRVALAINETVNKMTPPDPASARDLHLRRRVAGIEQENEILRAQLNALLAILIESETLTPDQCVAVLASVPSPLEMVSDDSESGEAENEPDSSPELDTLHAAQLEPRVPDRDSS